ncbi:hypothetical protein [Clostridium sp. Cult3]|uniref:hypothetical protein n=1 Tax=Clostridium sp. Cult3 TaxID=2079004 RepID=UPI001F29E9EE|nr:hypothetical protein [Clostridium sp. Cult3]MCF6459599.1 hypothetical protein [Clostridium sp. Cult3]
MKNFFEGLKDILYDGIDYIMMVLVIVIVALIINWRLGGLFTKDSMGASSSKSEGQATNRGSSLVEDSKTNQEKPEDTWENEDEKDPKDKNSGTIVKISIPAGSLPSKIGSILEDSGLVEDKNAFVQKAIDLNLETKLKYGDFEIPKDSSMEKILEILTK